MKKIKTIIITISVCLFLANYSVSAQSGGLAEIEFTNYVNQADVDFGLGNIQGTQQNLSSAEQILSTNPNMNIYLRGHYNKVKGKLHMTSSLTTALQYFNTSLSQFAQYPADQAKVKIFVGIAYYYAHNLTAAENNLNESKNFLINTGESESLAQSLNNLGVIAYYKGESQAALANCNQAYSINSSNGYSTAASINLQNTNYFTINGAYNPDGSYFNEDESAEEDPEITNNGGGDTQNPPPVNTNSSGSLVAGQ